MAVFNEPTKWTQALGATANADVIPNEAGAMDVDISKIFPAVFSVPLSQGGKAIPRRTLNGLLKLLGDWLYYYQTGGVPSYSDAIDYAVGRVVLYTDGNLYKCIQANNSTDPKAPTDLAYWTKIPTLSDFDEISFKTGDIKIHTTSTIPNGWLLCNGAGISRSTYSNLFTKIGTTYGTGDGSTTFNIPDLRDRYIIGANTNALGTYIAEQLPNVTGRSNPIIGYGPNAIDQSYIPCTTSGVFRGQQEGTTQGYYNRLGDKPLLQTDNTSVFSLANDNTTYVNSGRVLPLSIALNYIIKT